MTIPSTLSSTVAASSATRTASTAGGMDSLDQGDFLRLLTVQIQQQDPFDPVDNKEMLAQMAQFSALAGTTEMSATLTAISDKLDLIAAAAGLTTAATTQEN